jgi:5-methylcytosine-specific restriction protein A
MSRSVPEWVGKTDDTPPPPRVKLRIFERSDGLCHISGRKIMPGDRWQADHIVPLILGGENRESNMAPALTEPHKAKTKAEAALKSKIADTRKKHLGIKAKPAKIQSAGFPVRERPERPNKPVLPPRSLYK